MAPMENGKEEEKPQVVQPMQVKVVSKTSLFPRKKEVKQECPLVTFDLPYVTFYYNQKVLLYKLAGDYEERVEKLKEGLASVLDHFYPLSGRLGKDEEGVLRVEKCGGDDAGIEVVEAVAEDVGVDELAQDKVSNILQEIVPFTGVLNLEGFHRPLLSVQFTKLKDGLAVGCAFNHVILDGYSTWHFMSSWAQICRGNDTIPMLPFHDRTHARATRVKLDLLPIPAANANANGAAAAAAGIPPDPLLPQRVFRFSEAAIDKIKAAANGNRPPASKPFSTFQSLAVHLWRAVTRARGLKPEDITVFTIFMDCRKRVDPAMPDGYFGNLIQAVFTGTATGMLLAHPPEFGANLVQIAIDSHNAAAIARRSEEFEASPKLFQFKDAGMNCVAVGSSPRFRVYEVDFGWGKPERVRSGINNKFDGMVFLYPGKDGGKSVDVEISLDLNVLEVLEKDSEFTMA